MKNNKGFTLIELVAAVAVLMIVVSSAMAFLVSGSGNYNRNKVDVDLQQESQLAMNQLEDMIIDARYGVTYGVKVTGDSERSVMSDNEVTGEPEEKKLYIYNPGEAYIITWKAADQRLYYSKKAVSVDGVLGDYTVTDKRMADYVSGFNVDLSQIDTKGNISLHLEYEKKDGKYSSENNVTLRNRVAVNKETTEIYKGDIIVTDTEVTNVEITKSKVIYIYAGATYSYNSRVYGTKGAPSQQVTYQIVTPGVLPGTKFDGNILTIDPTEPKLEIKVKAISVADPTKESQEANVFIKRINSIVINLVTGGSYDDMVRVSRQPIASDTMHLSANVLGDNLESTDTEVEWSVKRGPATVDSNGLVSINTTARVGDTVEVVATSVKNDTVKQSFIVTVGNQKGTIRIQSTKDSTDLSPILDRRDSLMLKVNYSGFANIDYDDLEWDVDYGDATGIKRYIDEDDEAGANDDQLKLTVGQYQLRDLSYNQAYTITVTAKYEEDGVEVARDTMKITIPKVTVEYEFADTQVSTTGSVFLALGEEKAVSYKLRGIKINEKDIGWVSDLDAPYIGTANFGGGTTMHMSFPSFKYPGVGKVEILTPEIAGTQLTNNSITVNLRRPNISEGVGLGRYIPIPDGGELVGQKPSFETAPEKGVKCHYAYLEKVSSWKLILTIDGNTSYYVQGIVNGYKVWVKQIEE